MTPASTLPLSHPSSGAGTARRFADVLPYLAVVVLTACLLRWLPRPLTSDVAGQLWIARALRGGARLYVDIHEVNPPLWFWLAVPVDWLAERLRLSPADVLIAACGATALLSVAAADRLLCHLPPARRRALLVYAGTILLVMPLRDTAQREFLALAGAISYALLIAARRDGRAAPPLLAALVGLGAGVGFALKHYFLGVPLLLELWLIASLRSGWRPLRAETLALAAAGAAYAAAVLIVTPDYLATIVPQLALAYGVAMPGGPMVQPAQWIWLLLLILVATQARRLPALATALLLAAAGFAAAWLIQNRGWPYHAIPATGALALAAAALLVEAWERTGEVVRRVAPAALLLPVALALAPTHAPVTPANDIAPALAGLKPGDPVALISTEGFTAWPAAVDRGFRWSSRYGQYWMLGAIDARAHDARVAAFGREVARRTAHDYRCLPPLRIVVTRPGRADPRAGAAGDPLRWFLGEPAFARVFAHYRPWRRHGMFDTYRLARPVAAPDPATCRRAV